jgi:hypothetical protein
MLFYNARLAWTTGERFETKQRGGREKNYRKVLTATKTGL